MLLSKCIAPKQGGFTGMLNVDRPWMTRNKFGSSWIDFVHQEVCIIICDGDMLGLTRTCKLSSITVASFFSIILDYQKAFC